MLLLLLLLVGLVNLTSVQNYLARKGAKILSEKLKTRVEIKHIRIDFLNHFRLQGLYIEDQAKDTLLYAGEVQVRITDWFIFKDKPSIQYIGLQDAYAHLYRTTASKDWNYKFIEDAFSTGKKNPNKKNASFEFDLEKTELENVRVHMDDAWVGENLDFDIGTVSIKARSLSFDKKQLFINNIDIKNTGISIKEFKGGRPPKAKKGPSWEDLAHKTPFNPAGWTVQVKNLLLDGCAFHLNSNDRQPVAGQFDEGHLGVTNIQLSANDINIKGDTLHGNIRNLSAQERCGLAIKTMRSKVTISPNASICEDLYLETNNSKVQNYYAMHYRHFPDFNSYIDSVTMVAHLDNAIVDVKDIAYFAPQLKEFPGVVLKVNGDGKGTVADLSVRHLSVTDGSSSIRGNVTMKGLPDIYTTHITFTEGELMTSGKGIIRYAPALKDNKDVALDHIQFAYFKGSYEGLIENFSVNGTISTNLGTITTDVKMNIPGFNANTAVYSGSITANNVQVGDFLKQSYLGNVTLKEDFSGTSFDPDNVQLNIDGKVNELGLNNYTFHNITTHGIIAKKQFTGTLLVDDPNLALEFDGGINYSNKNIDIKATAHLLGSNFQALNLTKDTVTLSADFDLNCTGNQIDNFAGYAKLNNIDLKRNSHKLNIDSVLVNATGDTMNKLITIQSNDVTATIRGDYQLSKLPASVQYYLSRYIPNYISAPDKYAPNQNLEFRIQTRAVDSMFAVTIPIIRGFDSSVFSGSLNTSTKKLTLSAEVPHGSVGKFHMHNVSLTGMGDFDRLGLTTTIEDVVLGDSIVNGSLSLTTTVAHDSVGFTIATTAPDTSSSLTLNGQIIARKDSLFLTVFPSQFYLNQAKWDIAGGSHIVYSDKYLLVNGFSISSGFQKITANTELNSADKNILITTENLDLGQFGNFAGLSAYQPDGRLSGTVKINQLFGDLLISANIRATDVKFANDTLGTVNIIGTYDGKKQLINLDPQTGIFHNNSSVIASGNISFDSTTHQKLDGSIEFKNASVGWASPFLTGIMSHLSGTINGKVGFKGSSYEPVLDGTVNLLNAGFRLDYMGTNYTIPFATVTINNRRIEFGKVMIFDRWHNFAFLTGHFSHNLFKRMRMRLKVETNKFEAMNLASYENNLFYGNAIVSMDSLTLRGPFDSLRLNVYNAAPAAKSTIYLPVTSGNQPGTYTYVTFKDYGKTADKIIQKHKDKFSISIDAHLNTLAEMVMVLDPTNGDEIRARGDGYISMEVPPNNDMSIYGNYIIDYGTYTFTFNQLFIRRSFLLDPGSVINFNGDFARTDLNVDATYRVKAKLSDLLSDGEKAYLQPGELTDAQTPQWVNIALHMTGYINALKLTFDLDLEDKHSQNSVAYQKLHLINADARQQFAQVGSLLLVGQFVPPEGIGTGAAISGTVNNISQILSSSASSGLTAIINKLTGDKDLNIAVKYTNYNYSDQSLSGNRNELKIGVNKSLFKDKLLVEVGSTSDWGRPTSTSSSSNFNFTGDFRAQYKINKVGTLRLNAFRTSDYDVTIDRSIVRSGVGIAWRKSFDNLGEFFHGRKYAQRMKDKEMPKDELPPAQDSVKVPSGTE